MQRVMGGAAALAVCATGAFAGGIERSTQSSSILFEEGNRFEVAVAGVKPSLTGEDLLGNEYSNVADKYGAGSAALKFSLSENLDAAVIFDKPWGADVKYGGNPATTLLGGTYAYADTLAMTALLKYKFNNNFSVYGGIRQQSVSGEIGLRGRAYGAFGDTPASVPPSANGYTVELDQGSKMGYVVGVAYEIPDIAARVALTYNSAIEHSLTTTETFAIGGGPTVPLSGTTSQTKVKTPESINLEFQTGLNQNTLLFGSIRYVKHSQFKVIPAVFGANVPTGLVSLEDSTTYRLGLGRRFNEKWSGAITLAYEEGGDKLVSPLAPSTGFTQVGIGATYNASEKLSLSGGVSYTMVGNADPETGEPDVKRAEFRNNDVWGIGLKMTYKF